MLRSHPTWVRGLKQILKVSFSRAIVAPYVGAWIETAKYQIKRNAQSVAPYVGAWIETMVENDWKRLEVVAPYVGAWIETRPIARTQILVKSHPTWVRGLKPNHPA